MDQPLELFGQRLLPHSHRRDEEREIELRADRTRVGEDPMLFGGEVLETGALSAGRNVPRRRFGHRGSSSPGYRLNLWLVRGSFGGTGPPCKPRKGYLTRPGSAATDGGGERNAGPPRADAVPRDVVQPALLLLGIRV